MREPVTMEEAGEMLDQIAAELPPPFFKELNGGILLLPDEKRHPAQGLAGLYIIGEYHVDPMGLGRYITVYFGSFTQVHGHRTRASQREKLREVLLHEFTHHLESLAGEKDLAIRDADDILRYRRGLGKRIEPRYDT